MARKKIGYRTIPEIIDAAEMHADLVWYNRHMIREEEAIDPRAPPEIREIRERARAAAQLMRERYREENLGPWDDFEWGMINGKLSALRWVLGDEWDFLDT